jgi:hypothetical protein
MHFLAHASIWQLALIDFYFACWFLSYGIGFGYNQHRYEWAANRDYVEDMFFSLIFSFGGPISLVIFYFNFDRGRYGLKFF